MSKEMDSAQLIAQEEEINLLRKQVEQLEAENKRLLEALEAVQAGKEDAWILVESALNVNESPRRVK